MKSLTDDPKANLHASNPGTVELSRSGNVVRLTLAREKYLNAMTWTMYEQLSRHLEIVAQDTDARVVILQGKGSKALASGTDIHQFADFNGARGIEYEKQIDQIVTQLATLPKPTIAAIEGYAVGGGMALAAACDLRYGNQSAKIGIPIARSLGNCLALSNYRRLANLLGTGKVKELIYTARLMNADESRHCGFLTDIFPDQTFQDNITAVAENIAAGAPLTLWATKIAFIRQEEWMHHHIDDMVDFSDVIQRVYDSQDFHEAVAARMSKLPSPPWLGR